MPKKPRRKGKAANPNQLSLFDYVAPLKIVTSSAEPKPFKKRNAPREQAPERAAVLTPKQAAQYLNLSLETLKAWRAKKAGPVFTKRGARLIGYRPADLDAFLASRASH